MTLFDHAEMISKKPGLLNEYKLKTIPVVKKHRWERITPFASNRTGSNH